MSITNKEHQRRSRIILDARLVGYRPGGIARYASELAHWLPVVAPDLDVNVAYKRSTPNSDANAIRAFTPPHHRLERWTFGVEMALRRPAVVHATDFVAPRLLWTTKRIATIHDLAFVRRPELLTTESLRYYRQAIETLPSLTRIITVSEHTARALVDVTGIAPDRVTVIPNGVDHDRYRPGEARQPHDGSSSRALAVALAAGRPVLLMVGTVEPRKRVDIAIDAVGFLATSKAGAGPHPFLVVAGSRGWRAEKAVRSLDQLAERGDAVWLHGLDDNELAMVYRIADVLLLPSVDEGFGLSGLEAMASGVPVLAADVPSLKELLGAAGLYESSPDPREWAHRIATLLACDSALAEHRRLGLERAALFSWERTARQTADVYREVLTL